MVKQARTGQVISALVVLFIAALSRFLVRRHRCDAIDRLSGRRDGRTGAHRRGSVPDCLSSAPWASCSGVDSTCATNVFER